MKIVLIYSGGLDSTVLLCRLQEQGSAVRCLSVDYGQRHRRELDAAAAICRKRGLEHRIADLPGLRSLMAGSALTSPEAPVPEGHYTDETMKRTVVPNRNMVFLSLAIAWAISTGSDAAAYAAHAGDHPIYPDCRTEFIEAMRGAARLCDWRAIEILAPFAEMNKGEIVSLGARLGAPMGETWSCYRGQEVHCGVCGACVERREAFARAGVADPTRYAKIDN